MIFRTAPRTRYTVVPMSVVEAKISAAALGLLVYLLSKPDNWEVSVSELTGRFDCGKDYIYERIKELIGAGYMARVVARSTAGQIESRTYEVYDSPDRAFPDKAKPDKAKPDKAKPTLTSIDKAISTEKETTTGPDLFGKPAKQKKKTDITFDAFCAEREALGLSHLEETDPVWALADRIGLPELFVELAWQKFSDAYRGTAKRYKSWPLVFLKSVDAIWYKLWYLDGKEFKLTQPGLQAQLDHKKRNGGAA